jgi:farnesyl diphosphate synthase
VSANTPDQKLAAYQARVETVLMQRLPPDDTVPRRLHAAMRYSALGGGKRIRPALVYATGEFLGIPLATLDTAAAAIEMIHVYSLVHDDLPAMDDDALRRGRPTCHVAFDEATAILAGDALQVLAFEILTTTPASAESRVRMLQLLAVASGTSGMAGGQAIDLEATGRLLSVTEIEDMHLRKTGALIEASVALPIAISSPDRVTAERLAHYAHALGLAFQIVDDLLDVEGDPSLLGKTVGADAARNKPTYPAVAGLEAARQRASSLTDEACAAMAPCNESAAMLQWLARFITTRSN